MINHDPRASFLELRSILQDVTTAVGRFDSKEPPEDALLRFRSKEKLWTLTQEFIASFSPGMFISLVEYLEHNRGLLDTANYLRDVYTVTHIPPPEANND